MRSLAFLKALLCRGFEGIYGKRMVRAGTSVLADERTACLGSY